VGWVLLMTDSLCVPRVNVVYVAKDGARHNIRGKVGDNVLYLAHRHGIELEGGGGGMFACVCALQECLCVHAGMFVYLCMNVQASP